MSSTDPNGWVKNPPSTFLKITGTSRDALNNSVGLILNYNDNQRYLVHLPNQQQVLLKAENLQPCSYMEQIKAQYDFISQDPTVRRQLTEFLGKVRGVFGVDAKYVLVGALLAVVASIYFLGFSRTLLMLSFAVMLGMVCLPDLMQGTASWKVVLQRAPDNLKTLLRQSGVPVLPTIASNKYYFGGFCFVVLAFFATGMMPARTGVSSGSSSSSSSSMEQAYKLGFQDATESREYGASLASAAGTDSMDRLLLDEDDFALTSSKKSLFSISNAMSVMYLTRTVYSLGQDGGGGWNWRLAKQNLITLEPWKLGFLALSIYRLFSAVVNA
jgi:hypothetical protein